MIWRDEKTAPKDGTLFMAYSDGIVFSVSYRGKTFRNEFGAQTYFDFWHPIEHPVSHEKA